MHALLTNSEFASALIGAVVGGFFTLVGSIFSQYLQSSTDQGARRETAVRQFELVFESLRDALDSWRKWQDTDKVNLPKISLAKIETTLPQYEQYWISLALLPNALRTELQNVTFEIKSWLEAIRSAKCELDDIRSNRGYVHGQLVTIVYPEGVADDAQNALSLLSAESTALFDKINTVLARLRAKGKANDG